jgi:DNA-binding transcriptional LysR family regulator
MLEPARRMQQEAEAALVAVSGRDQALAGPVRLTATEGFAMHWLPRELAAIQARHPAIEIQLLVQNTVLDLLRREADIALRLGRPRQADLVGKKVADMDFALFASREYLERAGTPSRVEDLRHHQGVAYDEATRQRGPGAWLEGLLGRGRIVFRSNSIQTQLAAIRDGWGIGGQVPYFAARDGLVRILPEVRVVTDLWLVTHAGLRRSARIRAVFDHLAQRFEAHRAELAPSGAGS